jgi:type I restriction enzyme S subunit
LKEQKRIVEILDKAFEGIAQAEANTRRNLINARELFDSYLASIHSDREKLRNLVDIRTGKLNSNAAEENGIYPFFTCSRDVYRINDYAFDCEAILLAGNNASGDFNVKHYSGKFNAYQRTYVITINPEKRVVYRYLYYQLLHSLKEFKQKSVGAATKFLKIGIIQDMEIPLPNIYEQNKIVVNLDSLQTKTQKLETIYQRKLEEIAELKQSILEKAFTGQLSQ